MIPHRFHVDLPEALIKEIIKCKDIQKSVRQVGIDWCITQSKELKICQSALFTLLFNE
jgi:methylenetetrahydrofolate reductase (NADPH)